MKVLCGCVCSVNYIYVRLWLVGVQCLYLRILRSYILVFGSWGVVGVYVYLEVPCCICVFVDLPGIVGPHGQWVVLCISLFGSLLGMCFHEFLA